jgi:hypothetical protein
MKTSLLILLAFLSITMAFAADPAPDAGPPPSDAETKAVAELAKLGVEVRPIAAGINWRSVNVRLAAGKQEPKIFTLLKDVLNLQELDLAGVQLTDADLAQLAGLTNLRVLHLEKTPTTDAMLVHLKGLKNLIYLNLYGTQVTDAGLPQLNELTNLKSLYVFETKVTDAGIAALKQALPNVRIVKGWTAEDIAKLTAKAEEKKPAPAPDNKAIEAEIAEAQKKLDGLNAEIAKRREARGKIAQGTPEYEAADKLVQDIKPDIAKATAAVEAAKAKLKTKAEEKKPAPAPDNKAVEAEIAEAQKKLDALNAEIAKRREARGNTAEGTPEYEAANKLVQDIKPDIAKATATVEAAKAKLKKP